MRPQTLKSSKNYAYVYAQPHWRFREHNSLNDHYKINNIKIEYVRNFWQPHKKQKYTFFFCRLEAGQCNFAGIVIL